jgi:hypothetical protein
MRNSVLEDEELSAKGPRECLLPDREFLSYCTRGNKKKRGGKEYEGRDG